MVLWFGSRCYFPGQWNDKPAVSQVDCKKAYGRGDSIEGLYQTKSPAPNFPICTLGFFFFWLLFVCVYLFERSSQIAQVGFKHVAEARLEFLFLLPLLAEGCRVCTTMPGSGLQKVKRLHSLFLSEHRPSAAVIKCPRESSSADSMS